MGLNTDEGKGAADAYPDGCTSLHYAVKSDSLEAVKFLAKKAGLPDVVAHDGSTALHYVITGSWENLADLLRILIENGVDPCKARNDECTPLHILVNMIKSEWNQYGVEAFDQIFAAGRTLLERMLENSRSISVLRLGTELIYLACSHPFPRAHETVLALLGYGLDPNIAFASSETALMAAARRGDDTILNTLLIHGADPSISASGLTALHYAAYCGDAELLQLLIERSPSENYLDRGPIHPMHPIHTAILRENADCVKLLLDHLNSEGKGRIVPDQLGTLQGVLDRKVNVQVRSDGCHWYWSGDPFPIDNETLRPLDIAAIIGNSQIGSTLLAHGTSVGSLAGSHVTPLHYAAEKGQLDMVKVLLKAGANPNALKWNLQSPAMRAAEQGHVNCVRVLLEAGADIQLRDTWGQTALHVAAGSRAKDMFSFLMNKMSGYELTTESRWGGSALYSAMREALDFPMSFLLSLAPSAAAYASEKSNILNAAIRYRSTVEFKMLLRRIPAYLLLGLLNQRDLWTGTPLHRAAMDENLDIMALLLDTGAQLEIEACDHGTALMGACATGRLISVKFLVANGARTSYMQDRKPYSALLAAKYHPEVRRWLIVGRFVEGPRLLTYKDV